ncbi:hypothetical protein BTO06_13205 [Tenacibaculum sp. SZ-18]|jgi:uncharacterized membrane protein|uniref:hypothetical protein n=1 Tax=Tenacibaculum sp. SZ-18 TaxID=754423 RepID=UPI000C2D5C58|nr:hypothetical protein [Tenacibaculum sp. SZ-18]AUC16055.1 hypothetical protein BTO06_13205 [Tenacibaculum sp. SZ-18]MCH2034612.1 hypothetical protein [Tenacibaculum sp.]
MNKIWKYTQYGYIAVAVVLLIDAVTRWSSDRNQAYLSIAFAVFMLLIFLFKRNFRKKIERRNNQ